MITIDIPGRALFRLERLVTDFNGTIGEDGGLLDGVAVRLRALANLLEITVLTADTFGRVRTEMDGLPVKIIILEGGEEGVAKADYVRTSGSAVTVAIGNGFNDRLMLAEAALGLAVLGAEGTAPMTAEVADVWFRDGRDALDALLHPRRLIATLRS
jgi:soluble P-type ATPase